ncbi:MAG TPA: Gfo/Idh/MocA family oxidoreductase [Candidatus Latescibacteria bacterium]|nr:Gfo/Idh/MocA family oxidoreductase [Candidatus Latescibacterota bacterium]
MDRKINWGILGCAGIAERAFIPAVRVSRNGVLAGIAARDVSRARAWADRFGFLKFHRTYQELVEDPAIDAIYNPLPNDLHAEWSIRAIRAGKHVLCEKPMAMNAIEARAMIGAAEVGGLLLMEGFMYKFHPQMEKTLALIGEGKIGEVRSIHSSFTFPFERDGANYRWFPAMGGGALYDVGCYPLSVARLIFGEEPVSVFARARIDSRTGVDMTTAALIEFPRGRVALCDASFESHFQSRLLAVGTEGTLALDRAFSAKDFDVAIEIVRGDTKETARIPRAEMFCLMAEHFGDAVLGKTPLRYPAGDALNNMHVIDACFESIRTGRAVEIPNNIHQGGVVP